MSDVKTIDRDDDEAGGNDNRFMRLKRLAAKREMSAEEVMEMLELLARKAVSTNARSREVMQEIGEEMFEALIEERYQKAKTDSRNTQRQMTELVREVRELRRLVVRAERGV